MRIILVSTLAIAPLLAKDNEPAKRLDEAAAVFSEVMAAPDKGIPQELLENAHCIVIVPDLKTGAFIVGGKYGKGYLLCRNKRGPGWSAPATVRIEGGSFGFQIGGSSTDLIMLVMNERGAEKLLESKFTLGAEGSIAAGPVGRTATAQTDAQMHADILLNGFFQYLEIARTYVSSANDLHASDSGRHGVPNGRLPTADVPEAVAPNARPAIHSCHRYTPNDPGSKCSQGPERDRTFRLGAAAVECVPRN